MPQNQGDACLSEFALLQLREMGEEVVTECEAVSPASRPFASAKRPCSASTTSGAVQSDPSASNAPGMAGRVSHWMTQTAGASESTGVALPR